MFDTTWLNTRFLFDEAARSPQVNQACLNTLNQDSTKQKSTKEPKIKSPKTQNSPIHQLTNPPTQNPKLNPPKLETHQSTNSPTNQLHLLDVGSGTGANFLHFFEKIPNPQNWFFLDHDSRLLQASLERIKAYAAEQQYPLIETAAGLELRCAGIPISIQILSGSFEELENLLTLEELDIVMASAFFDLFTPAQLHAFLDKIFAADCSLLLTLNYAAMTFVPAHPLDKAMVDWYEKHMQRPQEKGQGMGPDCSRLIRHYLEEKQKHFWEGPSVWKIGGTDQSMLSFLLGFMEEALGELDLSNTEKRQVAEWLALRREQMALGTLALEVAHFDFFASV